MEPPSERQLMGNSRPRTRITILVDNNAQPGKGLVAEHGFSALIERDSTRVLFDTGQGPALIHNSRILGISLAPVTLVVLSHGHYDHTGGMLHVAKLNCSFRVVVHPDALGPRFAKNSDEGAMRSIGVPYSKSDLEAVGVNFEFITDFKEVLPGFWFTGQIPQIHEERLDRRLYTMRNNHIVPDPVKDEASLVVHTNSGWILLLGCAHPGLRNILEYASQILGIGQFHAIIGGTHLGMLETQKTSEAIEAFDRFAVQCIATAHCTGANANAAIKSHFGQRFSEVFAGAVFEF